MHRYNKIRQQQDLQNAADILSAALHGRQIQRALDNVSLSNVPNHYFPELINTLAVVTQAGAITDHQRGLLQVKNNNLKPLMLQTSSTQKLNNSH